MEHLKKFALAILVSAALALMGDLYFSLFGALISTVVAGHFLDSPGLTMGQFFTVWFIFNLMLSSLLANQWVLAVDNTHAEPRADTVARRGRLLLLYKVILGPSALGVAYAITYIVPPLY